jgi:hypothetical protein
MFKGISQCIPAMNILYFGPFIPFHFSPLPLYCLPPFFQQLSIRILISSISWRSLNHVSGLEQWLNLNLHLWAIHCGIALLVFLFQHGPTW